MKLDSIHQVADHVENRPGERWPYVLRADVEIEAPRLALFVGKEVVVKNKVWARVERQDSKVVVWIAKGYAFDGASVPLPRWLRRFFPYIRKAAWAALVHDVCYQMARLGVIEEDRRLARRAADRQFRDHLLSTPNIPRWVAERVYFAGVRLGGWFFWYRRVAA